MLTIWRCLSPSIPDHNYSYGPVWTATSSVQDDEMREVGNNKSEKERLLHAWTMYVRFHLNASLQIKRA